LHNLPSSFWNLPKSNKNPQLAIAGIDGLGLFNLKYLHYSRDALISCKVTWFNNGITKAYGYAFIFASCKQRQYTFIALAQAGKENIVVIVQAYCLGKTGSAARGFSAGR
jgi:hypothetical protein